MVLCAALWPAAVPAQNSAPAKAAICVECHGPNGNATIPANPILAGQTSRYLYLQMRDFQEDRRSDPKMSPIAKQLSRDEARELADYFAAQKPAPQPFKSDPAKVKLGRAKADETLCTMCHLGGFAGQNEIPRVAGQNYDYVVKQLRDFKDKKRTNDAGNMTSVSRTLNDTDIENLGHFLAGL
ncbi:MAG TPA: c-type cytochrome [Burkholderiaceae bacterium]|nr:c-type cytochrome [Burkholderiaceae bacterium]